MAKGHGAGRRWLPTVLVLILGSLWGAHFSVVKIASESGLPIGGMIAATASGAAFALLIICCLRRRLPAMSPVHLRFYLVCALLSYGFPFIVELVVAKYLAASLLTIIVTTDPVFTTAMAAIMRRERVTARRMRGLAIGAASSLLILIPGTALPTPELLGWTLLAFGVPISYAIYHNYVASAWPPNMDSWQAGTGEVVVSLALFLPFAAWQGDLSTLLAGWSAGHWAILLMVGSGVLEAYFYFEIVRRAGAVFVSQTNFVTVIAGVLWGMAIFDERPGHWLWLGAILLMYSLYLTRITDSPHDAGTAPPLRSTR